jgi:hypothetical protein
LNLVNKEYVNQLTRLKTLLRERKRFWQVLSKRKGDLVPHDGVSQGNRYVVVYLPIFIFYIYIYIDC